MSVRPREEALAPAIDKLLEGTDEFLLATANRMRNTHDPWRLDHLREIHSIANRLANLSFDLAKIKRETW